MEAAVLPTPRSWLDIYERMLNSIASFSRLLVSIKPLTPKTRKASSVMLLYPLKYTDSDPTHIPWMPRHTSWSVCSV